MHMPVLTAEVLEILAIRKDGTYVDATVGCGGHAEAILSRLGPEGRLLGVDRDPDALKISAGRLAPFGTRCLLRRGAFSQLDRVAADAGMTGVDGVLMDLGVSSLQLDRPERGFSFRAEGPLDMRMDPAQTLSAADLVRDLSAAELQDVIRTFGEEPRARRIATQIVRERERQPIRTTGHLARVVEAALGGRRGKIHPATRTFQALRMAVNGEEAELCAGLAAALRLLRVGGRLAVISFHSLEDRRVKRTFRAHAGREVALAEGGVRREGEDPAVRVMTPRPLRPQPAEVRRNLRARSAKLRVAERMVDHGGTA